MGDFGLTPGCRYLMYLTNGTAIRSTLDHVDFDPTPKPIVLIFKPELAGSGPIFVPWHAVVRYTRAA